MPRIGLVNILRLIWVVAILWYEVTVFSYQVSKCPWPQVSGADARTPATHVLLVADPQVLDHRSYPDRPPWLMWLSQWIVDFNMRKSWWATKQLRPDAVVFLGDMMDGGRFAMSDEEYGAYLRRAKSIFATDPSVPELFLPGNHDVGIGVSDDWSDHARERWITNFGPLQQLVEIANHTVVLLDAPGIVEDEQQRKISGLSLDYWSNHHPNGPIGFAKRAADIAQSRNRPTVLLTHIPLFRPRGTPCGPLRERGTILDGSGYGYENTLDSMTSSWILNGIRPSIIFSGDDHDYCEVHHTLPPNEGDANSKESLVKEISVKSFSIAMGIHRPGFQLLTLYPPSSLPTPAESTLADAPCFLPNQLNTYVSIYVPLVALSILIILFSHLYGTYVSSSQNSHYTPFTNSSRNPSPAQVHSSALPFPNLTTSNSSNTLQVLRNYDAQDDTGEADYMLPPPTPAAHITGKSRRPSHSPYTSILSSKVPMVWKFSVGGRKMVADLSSVRNLLLACGGCCGGGGRRGRSGVRGFLSDVVQVGWVAVGVFLLLALWFS